MPRSMPITMAVDEAVLTYVPNSRDTRLVAQR